MYDESLKKEGARTKGMDAQGSRPAEDGQM